MKRLLTTLLFAVALSARAHIGSPNVFFDGQAGPYPVHVVIRPPNVVPGLAEIAVRVEGDGVQRVTALPVFWNAGRKGAPPPDLAKPVPGETNLYSMTLWLMRPGGYGVEISVEGALGSGAVTVPVNAVATNTLGMSHSFVLMMTALAALLFAGAVRIAGAVSGEGLLAPGQTLDRSGILRSRIAMAVTAVVLLLALWGGRKWWNFKEREYREKTLYRAAGLSATVIGQTNQNVLELDISEPDDPTQPPQLLPDHGKLMHLFLIREPGLNVFAHLHPLKRSWQNFAVALPPLPAGNYRVYADITHETGFAETLTATAALPAPSLQMLRLWSGGSNDQICGGGFIRAAPPAGSPLLPDADDAWHVDRGSNGASPTNIARLANGRSMAWLSPGELVENRDLSLRFQLLDDNGQPEILEPYIGMLGHAVVRRDDGAVFAHIHPSGTFSMAAQEFFATNGTYAHSNSPNPVLEVSFPFAFPSPGAYHLWIQVKSAGKAYTGVFQAMVRTAK